MTKMTRDELVEALCIESGLPTDEATIQDCIQNMFECDLDDACDGDVPALGRIRGNFGLPVLG